MKKIIALIVFPIALFGQSGSELIIGVNIGAYAANKNTAGLYKGDVTSYNIYSIFSNPNYQAEFDNYFQYPYQIVETPVNSTYRVGLEVGAHIGKRNNNGELFIEMNFVNLEVQEYFTVAIDNPNNLSPDPTYQPLPIFGEERRSLINCGYSIDLYNENDVIVGLPIFAQLTNARLERNYIVVNNQQYNINHTVVNQNNNKPGGIGVGAGIGLTGSIQFNKQFSLLVGYYAQYSRINMQENLKPFGIQNSIFARVLIGKKATQEEEII